MVLTLTDLISLLIIYQSLMVIFSLILDKRSKAFFSRILICICTTIVVHFGYMYFENHGIISEVMLGPFFGLIYGPLYYTYAKSLIVESSNLSKIGIHFIPALIMLIIIVALGDQLAGSATLIGLPVLAHFITYLLLALLLIYNYRKQLMHTASTFHEISLFWFEIIIYLQLATIVIVLAESYFKTLINTNSLIAIIFLFTLILIHLFYYLGLKQVRLFKGFKEGHTGTIMPKEYSIPEELFSDYLKKLTTYVEQEKPYLEYDISLQDLSDKLSISTRNLSYIINKGLNRNYYSFINHYRLELAKQSLEDTDKPIKEIMYDSGFSNKATFNALFKKSTGLTPGQFRRNNKS